MSAPPPTSAATARSVCPLCGGLSRFALEAEDRNRRITSERFAYRSCATCATLFLDPVPDDISRYYGGGYHRFDADGQPAWKRDPSALAAEAWRVDMLRELVAPAAHDMPDRPATLIDIGAGAGGFAAAAARDGGFDVTAIEMDERCCEFMRDELEVRAIASNEPLRALAGLPPARVVTLWHVLEHLPAPAEVLSAAASALEPGGVLALALPNIDSLQFRLLGARWAHLDAPRHVCLTPPGTLVAYARGLGLELLARVTADPSGLACNLHGWVYALRRDPSRGPAPYPPLRAGTLLTAALAPVERRGRGAAVTLFLRKSDA